MTAPVADGGPFWVDVQGWVEARSDGSAPSTGGPPAERSGQPPVERLAVRLDEPPGGASCAVLYFHGFGSDQLGDKAAFFRARALASGLAFCSFDFRGHGSSEGDLRGLTLSRNLADAQAARGFLAGRGYSQVVLFGSSMGGATALWHGARHPRGVVAGCFIAPALTMAEAFVRFLGEEGTRQWRHDEFFRFVDGDRSCELGWGLVEDFQRFDRRQLGRIYRIPSLIFQGKLDDRVPWRMVRDFVENARLDGPKAIHLHLFEDGDHRLTDRLELLWKLTVTHLGELGIV